jgi:LmbE family N-acetylglucosaminyl deacetylase
MFGSLKAYSDVRFQEASRALAHVPNASFQRITKPDGSYFVELHLFEELTEASASLCALGRSFSPDAIISHAYEGAHIDHDTCSFLAMHAAADLSLMRFEVPCIGWMGREMLFANSSEIANRESWHPDAKFSQFLQKPKTLRKVGGPGRMRKKN